MHFHDQVLSEEDFEQLPPALRRKVSVATLPCPWATHEYQLATWICAQQHYRVQSFADLMFHITGMQLFVKVWRAVCRRNWQTAWWLLRLYDVSATKPNGDGRPAARGRFALSAAAPTFPLEPPRGAPGTLMEVSRLGLCPSQH